MIETKELRFDSSRAIGARLFFVFAVALLGYSTFEYSSIAHAQSVPVQFKFGPTPEPTAGVLGSTNELLKDAAANLPARLCAEEQSRGCFIFSRMSCARVIQKHLVVCLNEIRPQMPEVIASKDEGRSWGAKLGACALQHMMTDSDVKLGHSQYCNERWRDYGSRRPENERRNTPERRELFDQVTKRGIEDLCRPQGILSVCYGYNLQTCPGVAHQIIQHCNRDLDGLIPGTFVNQGERQGWINRIGDCVGDRVVRTLGAPRRSDSICRGLATQPGPSSGAMPRSNSRSF